MKITKKIIIISCMGVISFSSMNTIFAAEANNSRTTDVIYDNTKDIPDPEHPDDPQWAIEIPGTIVFTDTKRDENANVELIPQNGHALTQKNITVTVSSANNYSLKMENATESLRDPVAYTLTYDTLMTSSDNQVAILNKDNTKKEGTATLVGNAKSRGMHKDVLTYTASVVTSGN